MNNKRASKRQTAMLKLRWETVFKETEIGEIPRDWEVKELTNILFEITKTITLKIIVTFNLSISQFFYEMMKIHICFIKNKLVYPLIQNIILYKGAKN